jgi:hypothetical protein
MDLPLSSLFQIPSSLAYSKVKQLSSETSEIICSSFLVLSLAPHKTLDVVSHLQVNKEDVRRIYLDDIRAFIIHVFIANKTCNDANNRLEDYYVTLSSLVLFVSQQDKAYSGPASRSWLW